jgi:hypothetical protein
MIILEGFESRLVLPFLHSSILPFRGTERT